MFNERVKGWFLIAVPGCLLAALVSLAAYVLFVPPGSTRDAVDADRWIEFVPATVDVTTTRGIVDAPELATRQLLSLVEKRLLQMGYDTAWTNDRLLIRNDAVMTAEMRWDLTERAQSTLLRGE